MNIYLRSGVREAKSHEMMSCLWEISNGHQPLNQSTAQSINRLIIQSFQFEEREMAIKRKHCNEIINNDNWQLI